MMDFNLEYAAHQQELMRAETAGTAMMRKAHMDNASSIAVRIGGFQKMLGAAASCAWSASQLAGD